MHQNISLLGPNDINFLGGGGLGWGETEECPPGKITGTCACPAKTSVSWVESMGGYACVYTGTSGGTTSAGRSLLDFVLDVGADFVKKIPWECLVFKIGCPTTAGGTPLPPLPVEKAWYETAPGVAGIALGAALVGVVVYKVATK